MNARKRHLARKEAARLSRKEAAIPASKEAAIPKVEECRKPYISLALPPVSAPRMKGKICITTTFDHNYIQGGQTLFKSIRRHTDCTGIDFKVITADPEVVKELGAENCHFVSDKIKARYANVIYSKALPKERYSASWHRYEMFNFKGYDRVICIDSDCICLEDMSYLFSEELNQYDLISVEDHIVSKLFSTLVPELEGQGLDFRSLKQRWKEGKIDVQPALLVGNKSIVNETWYNRLLHYANTTEFTYSIDEGILNDFIYLDNLKIKLLPLEYDYQDCYAVHIPTVPLPSNPVIVHCQESKPWKNDKADIDERLRKWHDKWWEGHNHADVKTIVAIIVWNRFENLKRWIDCWIRCDRTQADLVVIHNLEKDNPRYEKLCQENGIKYVPRENVGFDIGAFQDVCRERLNGFPNNWDNLLWVTDDCIPMQKNFVMRYLDKLKEGYIPCYELCDDIKRHVRTTGFFVTKDISKKLVFPSDPIKSREDCYIFEHGTSTSRPSKKPNDLYVQLKSMGLEPCQVVPSLKDSPLWDSHCRASLKLMPKHKKVFPVKPVQTQHVSAGFLDDLAIKHTADKSSLYHNFAVKYDRFLSSFRESFTSILEIGVGHGHGLRMWVDYFPNAVVHGMDVNPAYKGCTSYSDRIKFHLLDQGNATQLKRLESFAPFDMIIDDGNHFWREQILSFDVLFPFVKKGGIYIIEDTCTSYWNEYNNYPFSCVEHFKNLVDEVNFNGAKGLVPNDPPESYGNWDKGWHRREDCQANLPEFESIHFLNSIIIIHKRK